MLAGLLGGYAMTRSDAPAANRLSQFLLFIGVIGAGAVVGFGVYEFIVRQLPDTARTQADAMFGNKAADWAVFWALATAAVVGGAVWWGRRTVLQHIAFGLGVGLGTLMLLPLLPIDGPAWGAGAVLAVLGLVWGALGLKGWLPPETRRAVARVTGRARRHRDDGVRASHPPALRSIGCSGSASRCRSRLWSRGLLIKRVVLLGFGGVGICVFAFQLIDATFRGTLWAPVAMLVAGLVFVGAAVFVAVRLPRLSGKAAPVIAPAAAEAELAAGEAAEPVLAAEKPEPQPIPLVAEILGYVGGAFAIGAAIALMATFWTPLGLWGRLAIAAAGAILGIAGGFAVGRQGSPGALRLEQFMLAIGTIAVGFFAGIVAYEVLSSTITPNPEGPDFAGMWAQSIGAWSAVIVGFVLWLRRRTGLLLSVIMVGIFGGIGTTIDPLAFNNNQAWWWSGAAFLVFAALLWIGAIVKFLRPENVAYAGGSIALFLGLQGLAFNPTTGSEMPIVMWTGLILSIAMIVASIPMKRAVILGFGAAGVVLWSVMLVNTIFGEQMQGPVLLLIIGVVFVAMAVLVAVLLPRFRGAGTGESSTRRPFGPHAGAPA